MNRKIKFRAKRLNSDEWIYGGCYEHINRTPYVIGDEIKEEDVNHLIINSSFSDWGMPRNLTCNLVNGKTVGQYTGLKDRNGKEIYEGDILLYLNTHKSIVNYKDGAFIRSYRNGNPYLIYDSFIEEGRVIDYEVIGNIYENHETLEAK